MKKFLLALLLANTSILAQQKPEIAFIIKEKDIIPEGITYDPQEKAFYLSSIQKRKILKITETGKVSDFVQANQDGMKQVLGMAVDAEGRLWACNNTPDYDTTEKVANVHVYDLKTGKLYRKFELSDGKKHLFNDLCFDTNGHTYITDSDGGAIYHVKNGSELLEEILPPGSLRYPNGITLSADGKRVFVNTGSALGIVAVDLETKKFEAIKHYKFLIFGGDGMYRYKNTLISIQNILFPEGIVQFHLSSDEKRIEKMNFLASNDPKFDTPTTGVIVGDYFYFIANSQLLQIIGNKGAIKNPARLTNTYIMKIKLN